MTDPTVVVVTVLAVYRLTLLATADTILDPPRDNLVHWLNERRHGPYPQRDDAAAEWEDAAAARPHRLAYLLDCPWCASVWLAPPVVASALWWSDGWGWWLTAGSLAASGVTGLLATLASPASH